MGTNGYFGQIKGPFESNQELFQMIKKDANRTVNYVGRLGIQATENDRVFLNNVEFIVGKTGILEARSLEIKSIKFAHDVGEKVIIDYLVF